MPTIPYKSFCWSLGTTSYRTENFNKNIEEQLSLLKRFWDIPKNNSKRWMRNKIIQNEYYQFMKQEGFVDGKANKPDKDAREKTSGLVDIGLVDSNRRLTEAGQALLEICDSGDFSSDNFFQIPKDSYIYLKQLLKTYNTIDGNDIRPLIVLLFVLSKMDYLTLEEFTYLLPLCTNHAQTQQILEHIVALRNNEITVEQIILSRLMSMNNYAEALQLFLENEVDENLICTIGMNRNSGPNGDKKYDKVYLPLYEAIYKFYILKDSSAILSIYDATKAIKNSKVATLWRKYLFDTSHPKAIAKNPELHLKQSEFNCVNTEFELKTVFFKVMHLFKAKSTLSDYLDLNRRYLKTTDIVIFEDDAVKLDIIPKHFFNSKIEKLYADAYSPCLELFEDCSIQEISACLAINEEDVINSVNDELGVTVTTIDEARMLLEDNRYERLRHLIDTKFSDEQIINLLNCFESRNDTEIRNMVTDNADVPTIFEYVLGIMWYKISEYQGKILDYMKLSLDANLLPKTHAAGGEADIVYEYASSEYYPEHTMLLEATLADGSNQRRMEMEPVSRHLGQHLLRTGNMSSFCVFATTFLHINVLADFRGRKTMYYYDTDDHARFINGMKIVPIQTNELKIIVSSAKTYKELYPIFEAAYNSDLPPHEWYNSLTQTL